MILESGGRVYAVLEPGKSLIPRVGFHLPGRMAGVWFGPFRVVDSISVEMGEFISFDRSSGVFKYEHGELRVLSPLMRDCFIIKASGRGRITLAFDETPSWLSDKLGWKQSSPILQGGNLEGERIRLVVVVDGGKRSDHGSVLRVDVSGDATIKIYKGMCESFEKEMERKERFRKERGATWDPIKDFLISMYLDSGYGKGLMAGLEEYPWWFSVDLFFTTPVLLKKGLAWIVKDTLETILGKTDGIPPHEIVNNGVVNDVYNEFELFAIVSTIVEYTLESGDTRFLPKLKELIVQVKRLLREGIRGRGMVELEGYEGKLLDLDSFAYKALKDLRRLEIAGLMEMDYSLRLKLKEFGEEFLREWFDPRKGLFRGPVHFTQVLPMYFNLVPLKVGKIVLKNLKRVGMIGEKGLKHSLQPSEDDGYYGEKSEKVWWIANAILKRANKLYGHPLDLDYLEKLFEEDTRNGYPPEIVGGKEGCFAQSWSTLFSIV